MSLENHQNPGQHPDGQERARSTGPRTPQGKAVSSQNATTHGCRSKTLILPDEDPAEYESLHKNWWDHYQPAGQAEETLVKQLIDNHWYLMRAEKRREQVDFGLPAGVLSWTADQQKLFNNMQRYKTAAERAFQKSFHEVETYLRDDRRDKIAAEKADLMRVKMELQIKKLTPKPPPPPRKFTPIEEIRARLRGDQDFHYTPERTPMSDSDGPASRSTGENPAEKL
ncbi:MAG TPA: hypothetical protein VHZ07_08650 [Bryobacteraceae bacterium]|jgi:hypothetical protein|nr:hypothetical protein [Bryobacteraceae bacterium]